MTDLTTLNADLGGGDLQTVLNAGAALAGCGELFAVLPDGYTLHDLEGYDAAPRRTKRSETVVDVSSLDRYLARFDSPNVAAFASLKHLRIRAVLDYDVSGEPHWGEHVATLQLQRTREWEKWQRMNKQKMGQLDFAEHVEDLALTITSPSGAELLELVRDVQMTRNVEFQSKVELAGGDFAFKYSSETKGVGQMVIPERITLALSLFRGQPAVSLEARVRFRIDDGGLKLWYDLIDADAAEELAMEDVIAEVSGFIGTAKLFRVP